MDIHTHNNINWVQPFQCWCLHSWYRPFRFFVFSGSFSCAYPRRASSTSFLCCRPQWQTWGRTWPSLPLKRWLRIRPNLLNNMLNARTPHTQYSPKIYLVPSYWQASMVSLNCFPLLHEQLASAFLAPASQIPSQSMKQPISLSSHSKLVRQVHLPSTAVA